MSVDALFQSALQRHQSRRFAEAEALYRQVLSLEPTHLDAMQRLGILLHQLGRTDESIDVLQQAIGLDPSAADCQSNLGVVLAAARRWNEALTAFQRALELGAQFPQTHNNLGNVLQELDRPVEAVEAYRRAIELKPDYADAHNHLGALLVEMDRRAEGIEHIRRALAIRPDFADAMNNLGNALRAVGDLDGAAEVLQRAVALRPDWPEALNNLGSVLQETRKLHRAIECYRKAIAIRDEPRIWDNLLLAILAHDSITPAQIYDEHARWNERCAKPLEKFIRPHDRQRESKERLRIGYVSPDFYEHPVGRLVLPGMANHDHARFEIFCYSDVRKPDAITARTRSHADAWLDVTKMNDEQLAERVRQDRIEILVDLALHTNHNRLLAFARKPARVQVTWAGYPGTTGLSAMDYRLSDSYLDPSGPQGGRLKAEGDRNVGEEQLYTERMVFLPHCFWCFDPQSQEPQVNELPALRNGFVTFGCLNHFSKITDETLLSLWSEVLLRVPDSRLLLLAPRSSARQELAAVMHRKGIDGSRIIFADRQPRPGYLRLYHQIDLVLDTFPYTGHTTTLDALWMGVPVVSMYGQTAVSRGGLSILSNAGLGELVASDSQQFIAIASALAADLPKLKEHRTTLRDRLKKSPLMDVATFTRDLESAFQQVWIAVSKGK